jgi:hypothetical protein
VAFVRQQIAPHGEPQIGGEDNGDSRIRQPMGADGSMTTPALQKDYDKVWQGFDKAQL